jgi:hypothetical protein
MEHDNEYLKLPYAIDFDGCLAHQIWPEPGEGPPIHENIDKLEEVKEAGHDIIIHSARPWSDFRKLERWLQERGVPYDGIILGKYLACKYVDDKSVPSDWESWL